MMFWCSGLNSSIWNSFSYYLGANRTSGFWRKIPQGNAFQRGFKKKSFERPFSRQSKMRFLQQIQVEQKEYLEWISHFRNAEGNAASLASLSWLHLVLTRTHLPSILNVACQARLRGLLKTRMSPSIRVIVSWLSWGIQTPKISI